VYSIKRKIAILILAIMTAFIYVPKLVSADDKPPVLITIIDTMVGTDAFGRLVAYGQGGHSTIGAAIGSALSMSTNPGIGLGIGSGGNGYRPNVMIAIWTHETIDSSAALAAVKSLIGASSNPITTNGDCAIACDGTTQTTVPETTTTTTTTVPETTTATTTTVVSETNTIASETTTTTVVPETTTTTVVPETTITTVVPTTTTTTVAPVIVLSSDIQYNTNTIKLFFSDAKSSSIVTKNFTKSKKTNKTTKNFTKSKKTNKIKTKILIKNKITIRR